MSQKASNEPKQNSPTSSFRALPVQQRSIWESWAVLPARTRLYISLGLTGFALAGIYVSNKLEKVLPAPPDTAEVAQGATKEVPPP